MKKKIFLVTATLLLVPSLLMLGSASAHYRGGCDGFGSHRVPALLGPLSPGGPMRGLLRLADELELDKEQRNRIWEVMDSARPQLREQLEALLEGRLTLRNTLKDEAFDEDRVRQLADAQGQVLAELILLKTRVRYDISQILTPEQRQELQRLRAPLLDH